ncbi:MAG: rhodanese-like domain-containing protein [Saprospiraceae bacterium]|nr:rhodanese-like domain-containing protein [Saprospiraceae bacterium]
MAVQQISLIELEQWKRDQRQFILIDVREPHEHRTNNIGGDLIPLSELNRRFRNTNPSTPVVFYCQKGIRSQIAIQRLQQKYPDAEFYNLKSGLASE